MYIVIWEFKVKVERVADFEEIYSPRGAWAKLFAKSKGYLGMELLSDQEHIHRYITIDRWRSSEEYSTFLAEWASDYANLDAKCEGLTEQELLLGKWVSIS